MIPVRYSYGLAWACEIARVMELFGDLGIEPLLENWGERNVFLSATPS